MQLRWPLTLVTAFACSSPGVTPGLLPDAGDAPGDAAGDTALDARLPDARPPSDGATPDVAPPTLETVHFIGRFDTSDPAGPTFDWSASAIATRFSGTGLSVQLADNADNFFEVVVDGKTTVVPTTSAGAPHSYVLAANLAPGEHDVLLYKRTEAFFSTVKFLNFTVAGGQLVPRAYDTSRRIELVGDSITCGYGDEGQGPGCSFSGATENEYLAYGALTARALGAEQVTLAWSGKGVYRNYDGTSTETLPVLYERTIAADTSSLWAWKSSPDAIVVNLGTNDFATGDPGQPFVDAFDGFVKKLRAHNPGAAIFCALGSMLGGANLTSARAYLNSVVAKENQGGDARVYFVELAPQDIAADGAGCDYHPSLTTHQKMAAVLTSAIKAKLGW